VSFSVGSEFAGYRIEAIGGQGGMGVVYRARQIALDRPVALKVIAPDLADDGSFRERFKRESHMAASIDHPNVIPVYEAGESDGQLFIAMRWMDGTDLRALIAEHGRLPLGQTVRIVGQVAAALDAAHQRGLVHRDVKPANVLVTGAGEEQHAYLTDFGLTKRSSSATGLTRTGQFVGTADYAAPEQIMGKSADARTDIYALGCVLFHALAGVVPFERDTEVATIYAHLSDPPPPLGSVVPNLPDELDKVTTRALAKEPDERFLSAGDLARAARSAARGDIPSEPETSVATGPAAPAPPTAPAAAPTEPAAVPTEPAAVPAAPTPPSPGARRRGPAIAVAAAVVVLAVVAVLALAGGGDEDGGDGGQTIGDSGRTGASPRVADSIRVGGAPDGIAVTGNDVWFVDAERSRLHRIDARSGKLVGDPVPVGRNPDSVVAEGDVAWVTNADDGTVTRVEIGGDPVAAGTVEVGGSPEGISLGKQLVWVATGPAGGAHRIDRASATTVGAPIGVGEDIIDVFVGETFVWASDQGAGTVVRINSSTAEIVGGPIQVGARPRAVVETEGSAWVANSGDGTVTRLNARSGRVTGGAIRVGDNPRDMAFGEGFVWVANTDSNSVSRIDPQSGRVVGQPIAVGAKPANVTVAGGSVWVTNTGDGTVTRIDPDGG
jgi:serine/threonine-protein kinase